ncbi:MAG: hypothetical protein Q4A06_00605 [Cardiobacteriaceae bacterium]|nr:hypothetical protein [Cardiobacteriaceae bacterium]
MVIFYRNKRFMMVKNDGFLQVGGESLAQNPDGQVYAPCWGSRYSPEPAAVSYSVGLSPSYGLPGGFTPTLLFQKNAFHGDFLP